MDDESSAQLIKKLWEIGSIKFGSFKLKSGEMSPIYFDLRQIISHPQLLKEISSEIWKIGSSLNLNFDVICGIPYTALPIATMISSLSGIPMILKRKESKSYGTKQMVEGAFNPSHFCLLIEDVVTTGSSIIETATVLRSHELIVSHVICILDRGQGGVENLAHSGIQLHSLLSISQILATLQSAGSLTLEKKAQILHFLAQNLTSDDLKLEKKISTILPKVKNEMSSKLLKIMLKKRSNLCISFDLGHWADVIKSIEILGPFICVAKTHVDIYNFESYEQVLEFRRKLKELSERDGFLILEDRKLSDIGWTVEKQLSSRPWEFYKWVDLMTVHGIPGPGILKAFTNYAHIGTVLIAQMSSQGNLASLLPTYSQEVLKLTSGYEEIVCGFVSQSSLSAQNEKNPHFFLQFTPGVSLESQSDSLGQMYTPIEEAILKRGADVIIVGRGILNEKKEEWERVGEEYRRRGWSAWREKMLAFEN